MCSVDVLEGYPDGDYRLSLLVAFKEVVELRRASRGLRFGSTGTRRSERTSEGVEVRDRAGVGSSERIAASLKSYDLFHDNLLGFDQLYDDGG